MRGRHASSQYLALCVAAGSGCLAPPLESPPVTVSGQPHEVIQETVRNKVDVLFMVDNSASMSAN